jgi:DNA polymerase III epsilon subunit-like protein
MKHSTVFFDIETGGLEDRHPTIQIGAVAVNDGHTVDEFERKIKFDPSICDPRALEINAYTDTDWSAAVDHKVAMTDFAGFCQSHAQIVGGYNLPICMTGGHNAMKFDLPKLRRDSRQLGVYLPIHNYILDTYALAIWYFTLRPPFPVNLQLDTLCDHFGIQQGHHDALNDSRATVELARKLTAGANT